MQKTKNQSRAITDSQGHKIEWIKSNHKNTRLTWLRSNYFTTWINNNKLHQRCPALQYIAWVRNLWKNTKVPLQNIATWLGEQNYQTPHRDEEGAKYTWSIEDGFFPWWKVEIKMDIACTWFILTLNWSCNILALSSHMLARVSFLFSTAWALI